MLSVHARCRLFTAAARAFHLPAFLNAADSSLNAALPFDRATVFTELGGSLQEVVGDSLYPFTRRARASERADGRAGVEVGSTSGLESKSRACVVTARGLVVAKKKMCNRIGALVC